MADLGIAVGSAVKTASLHNIDNRVMYSAGAAARSLDIVKPCSVAYGIPLKASGKIFSLIDHDLIRKYKNAVMKIRGGDLDLVEYEFVTFAPASISRLSVLRKTIHSPP